MRLATSLRAVTDNVRRMRILRTSATDLADVFVVDDKNYTPQDGHHALEHFLTKWGTRCPNLRAKFREADRGYNFSDLYFPYRIQRMIYTTN